MTKRDKKKQQMVDFGFNAKEIQATEELAAELDLNVFQVLRHALRVYQAVHKQYATLKWKNEYTGCSTLE